MPVFDFNTPQTVDALGSAISGISEEILRNIEVTIKKYERESVSMKPEEYTMPIWRISARPTNGCGMRRGTFSLLFQSSNDLPYPCGM